MATGQEEPSQAAQWWKGEWPWSQWSSVRHAAGRATVVGCTSPDMLLDLQCPAMSCSQHNHIKDMISNSDIDI